MKKQKNTVIVLYGAMGVGKLTIGKLLSKKLNFKLTHNHLINDLVDSVFERGKPEREALVEELRYEFYRSCVLAKQNIIITHCYLHDYISSTGLKDPVYLKRLESMLTKAGAEVFFIHLKANKENLLKRISSPDRKRYKKLVNKKIMKKILQKSDFSTSAPVHNNLAIDTSNKKVTQTVESIINYLKK